MQIEKVFRCCCFELDAKEDITIDWREALLIKVFRLVMVLRLYRLFRFRVSFSTYSFIDYFKGFEKVEAVTAAASKATVDVGISVAGGGKVGVSVEMDLVRRHLLSIDLRKR